MAKRKAGRRKSGSPGRSGATAARRRAKTAATNKKRTAASRAPKRAAKSARTKRAAAPKRVAKAAPKRAVKKEAEVRKLPRLDRARRTLEETVPTPPSSLDMDRHSSAARSGRAEMAENQLEHRNMSPEISAGDVDVDLEDAYFTGEEAPGGDNPTPDQDIVDDIGKALGVEYNDDEELKAADKVTQRDKHRWELDPASSEDYKDRE
jgi:hypothetical protein